MPRVNEVDCGDGNMTKGEKQDMQAEVLAGNNTLFSISHFLTICDRTREMTQKLFTLAFEAMTSFTENLRPIGLMVTEM